MLALAVLGGTFLDNTHGRLDPLNWLFGSGLGTNIGASILWGALAGFIGYLVARRVRAAWKALHQRLDAHRDLTDTLHERLTELHERLDALHDRTVEIHHALLDAPAPFGGGEDDEREAPRT